MAIYYEGELYSRSDSTGAWYDSRRMKAPSGLQHILEAKYQKELAAELEKKSLFLPGADEPNTYIEAISRSNRSNKINLIPTDGKIQFGKYPQGVNGEILPISWLVINADDDKLLLMSEFCLDTLPMTNRVLNQEDTNWYNSYMRAWLNTYFFAEAFSNDERELIIRRKSTDENIVDLVSLLSEKEIDYYLFSDNKRKTNPTPYAKKKGVGMKEPVPEAFWWARDRETPNDKNAYWWTRDCGKDETLSIKPDGSKGKLNNTIGSPQSTINTHIRVGIRPVIMVQKNMSSCSDDVDGYIFLKCGINGRMPNKDILYIYKGNIRCRKYGHSVVQATAVMHGKTENEIKMNVEYCTECKKTMLNYTSYEEYRKKYGVIIGNLRMVTNGSFNSNYDLAEESPLKLSGYTVNQQEDLDSQTRKYILVSMIYENIMTKGEVIGYLEHFIRLNGQKSSNDIACRKWRDDLEFVQNYNINLQPKIAVSQIKPYSSSRYY